MITGNIKNKNRYYNVLPCLEDVFKHLGGLNADSSESFDFGTFHGFISTPEKSDLAPDGTPKLAEAHVKYIDIHYVIEGSEGIGYANTELLETVKEYDEKDDYLLCKGKLDKVILRQGDFMIVFPEDAHAPAMTGDNDPYLKKAVVKIKL